MAAITLAQAEAAQLHADELHDDEVDSTGEVYSLYVPKHLPPGYGCTHPADVVETATLAAVSAPPVALSLHPRTERRLRLRNPNEAGILISNGQ